VLRHLLLAFATLAVDRVWDEGAGPGGSLHRRTRTSFLLAE
jgi:hypothetical protein